METQIGLFDACRAAILHGVGELTVYRIKDSVPLTAFYQSCVVYVDKMINDQFGWLSDWCYEAELRHVKAKHPGVEKYSRELTAISQWLVSSQMDTMRPIVDQVLLDLISEDLMWSNGSGAYGLTAEGVLQAVDMRSSFTDETVTSLWIRRVVTSKYNDRLVAELSRKCVRSAQFGEIQDLINNYFCGIVRRDTLHKRIRVGKHPAFSDIRCWIFNTALSQWRDEGRDAQTRAFKGALTEKDLRLNQEDKSDSDVVSRSLPTENQAIFLVADVGGGTGPMVSSGESAMPMLDVVAGDLEAEIMHRITFERGIERACEIARASRTSEEVVRNVLIQGWTAGDVASSLGVSKSRANMLITNIRDSILQERQSANLELEVLKYVSENPFSSRDDLIQPAGEGWDCGLGVDVPQTLLAQMVSTGLMICRKGAYQVTHKGSKMIFGGDSFGSGFATNV